MTDTIMIKVGGSILSLSEEDLFSFDNANNLKSALVEISSDKKFVLTIGGGYLTRKYQQIMKDHDLSIHDQHQIGIASINMNAVMLKAVFGDLAEENVLRYKDYDSEDPIVFNKTFMITAAGSPEHSSDWNTVKLAIRANSKTIFSLKNVDGVYTADPKKDPSAKRIDKLSWDEYLNIIGNPTEFEPGGHYPVDPLASRMAKEHGIKFIIVDGTDLENMKKAMNGENFVGTTIN